MTDARLLTEEDTSSGGEQADICADVVLDLKGVETFKFLTVLRAVPTRECCQYMAVNPVRVSNSEGQTIGYAVVIQDSTGRCLAHVYLRRDCPERLEIETGSRPLWPHTTTLRWESPWIVQVQVLEIAVDSRRPHDLRIPMCGEPVL